MKNYKLKLFTLSVAALSIAGCASSDLKVTSTPDKADVYLSYDGEQPEKVGQTPLRLDERLARTGRGRYAKVEIRKEGFKPESVMVPLASLKSAVEITTKLEESKLPEQCTNQTAAVEKISRGIAESQSMVKQGNLLGAQGRLSALINEFPNVTVLHDLLGNVHYIGKNLDSALKSYERSLNIDPTNADTQRMAGKIREILGRRNPASGEGK